MARKRLISPAFFKHSELYEAEESSGLPLRVAFAGLWTVADKRGIFTWSRNLKPDLLPYDRCDLLAVLEALEAAGFVRSYEVDGKRFGIIPSFGDHQTFHHAERPSKDPSPPDTPEASPRLVRPEPQSSPTVTGTGTVAGTGTNYQLLPDDAKRPRRAGKGKANAAPPPTWLTPYLDAWDRLAGAKGTVKAGQAATEFALLRKHHSEAEILRRLAWYFENRGQEHVLPPHELARRHFACDPSDFRKRFGRLDPSAPSDHGEAA